MSYTRPEDELISRRLAGPHGLAMSAGRCIPSTCGEPEGRPVKAVAVWPERRSDRAWRSERLRPSESATSARLRVLDVGVCGTDAEICRFDYGGTPPPGEDHLVVGHEALGQVVEVGSASPACAPGIWSSRWCAAPAPAPIVPPAAPGIPISARPGSTPSAASWARTASWPRRSSRRSAISSRWRRTCASRRADGAAHHCREGPAAVPGGAPALAVARSRDAMPSCSTGARALVLGAGPVGLLGCMLLRLRGMNVTVYSRGAADDRRADAGRDPRRHLPVLGRGADLGAGGTTGHDRPDLRGGRRLAARVRCAGAARAQRRLRLYRRAGTKAPHPGGGRRDHASSRPAEPDRARHGERRTDGFRVGRPRPGADPKGVARRARDG